MCTHDNPYPFLSAEQLADLEREARDINKRILDVPSAETMAKAELEWAGFVLPTRPKGGFEFL